MKHFQSPQEKSRFRPEPLRMDVRRLMLEKAILRSDCLAYDPIGMKRR